MTEDTETQTNDSVDFSQLPDPTNRLEWRMRAVQLAVRSGLAGQAFRIHDTVLVVTYQCSSVHEPRNYNQEFDRAKGTIHCDCRAGLHMAPCKHAGAALLLAARLVPERHRTPEGLEP